MWIVLKHRTIWHKEFGHQRGSPSILRICVPENLLPHFLTLNHDSINIVKVPSCNKTLNNSLLISQSLFFPLYQRRKSSLKQSAKSSAQSRDFTRSPKPSPGLQSCACSGEPPRPSTLLLPSTHQEVCRTPAHESSPHLPPLPISKVWQAPARELWVSSRTYPEGSASISGHHGGQTCW